MSASVGPGRRPGKTAATLAMEQHFLELNQKYGLSVAKIAEINKLSASRVHEMVKDASAASVADNAATVEASAAAEPQPPRRMSRRTLMVRGWEYAERNAVPSLSLAACDFWVRLVVAIHENGDGFRLHLGEPGRRFEKRADLVMLRMAQASPQEVDVDGWLAELCARGRLIDIGGVDIGIPAGLGLAPGENARGEPMKPRAPKKPAASGQAPLPFRPMVVTGGRSDSSEMPLQTPVKSPISLESDSSEIPAGTPVQSPISLESVAGALTAAAAANALKEEPLSSSSSTGSRAGDSSEIGVPEGISLESDSSEIAASGSGGRSDRSRTDSTDISSQRSPLADLTTELAALARLGRAANADDLGAVQAWSDAGETPGQLREAIEIKRRQIGDKAVSGLAYFNGCIKDARVRRRLPDATAALTSVKPAPAPVSPADQALASRLFVLNHPHPPVVAAFHEPKTAALAQRWLELGEACLKAGRGDLRLPDFTLARLSRATFDEDMLAIEEALTSPAAAD